MMLMAQAFRHVGWRPHHAERSLQHPSAQCRAHNSCLNIFFEFKKMFYHLNPEKNGKIDEIVPRFTGSMSCTDRKALWELVPSGKLTVCY